jgi:ubiquinone/menaquinone biosynthesis C-methylase UbiE
MEANEIKNEIKKKYDNEAGIYDDYYLSKAAKHFVRRKIETALSFNKIKKGQKCLEIGSATGIFSFEFVKFGIDLTSIDLSRENIKIAQRKNTASETRVEFRVGDVENINFEDETFDGVFSFSTLRYVPEIKKALSEINRTVKPGGYIILDFPNKNCPWFKFLKKPLIGKKHIHDNQYSRKELRGLLSGAGFKNIYFKTILFTPKVTPNSVLPIIKACEYIGERIPVIKNTAAIIFCCGEKK